ncbi:unnamed protein product [Dovyalis caffra]|uniref:Uncharacterized protein n=1 Tax=Dovyalis caffra TaxID=77055 RepID=A0AAV1RU86_9ROSI|nr:unnamed protein product [Dovyalis caffra]
MSKRGEGCVSVDGGWLCMGEDDMERNTLPTGNVVMRIGDDNRGDLRGMHTKCFSLDLGGDGYLEGVFVMLVLRG